MFYVQAPKGLVTLHSFEETVFSRFEYLNAIDEKKNRAFHGKFEYLLVGSSHDCVGHFTLRLLTAKSNELFSYWLRKEKLLLQKRLDLIQPRQLYKLFKTILRHVIRRKDSGNPVDVVLIEICSFYLIPKHFRHLVSKLHCVDCTHYHHKIDFELVPDLLEERLVELSKGFAKVYCSQWRELLLSLFQTFVSLEMKSQEAIRNHFLMDPRMNILQHKLYQQLLSKGYNTGRITASNIDEEASFFPPCMEHLHLELRHKHRLSHYARFYYTLFLKECGMNLEQAIIYWRNEYSKQHSCTSLCVHDWQTDAKKFIYSIRHMYGLEGGRKNYRTPSCQGICNHIPGSNYEGGCPFKNFDTDSLRRFLLRSMTAREIDEFQASTSREAPEYACARYFMLRSSAGVSDVDITKPVQYYTKMIELN